MKCAIVVLFAAMLLLSGIAFPCAILNPEQTNVGSSYGVKGACSNNGLPVTCVMKEGMGIECDGPGGGFIGYYLGAVIFIACECSIEQENEELMRRDLNSLLR